MIIYPVSPSGVWAGDSLEWNPKSRFIAGAILSPPPDLAEGETAVWTGAWQALNAAQLADHQAAYEANINPPIDLEAHHANAMRAIVAHINIITNSALTAYPAAEVESWPIQKVEAETILAAETPALTMAPFLAGVCQAQFGPADDETRLDQVIEKAGAVKANADAWAAMAAYVNGLRARTQLAILAADDVAGIDAALSAGVAEGDAFKDANGL